MSEALFSRDEFQQLQDQLLALRESNYQLLAEKKKLASPRDNEKSDKTSNILKDPFAFANKLMHKNRTPVENGTSNATANQLDHLRSNAAAQEEQFRLQQQTMREELHKTSVRNAELERQLDQMARQFTEKYSIAAADVNTTETCTSVFHATLERSIDQLSKRETELNKELAGQQQKLKLKNDDFVKLTTKFASQKSDFEQVLAKKSTENSKTVDLMKKEIQEAKEMNGSVDPEVQGKLEELTATVTRLENSLGGAKKNSEESTIEIGNLKVELQSVTDNSESAEKTAEDRLKTIDQMSKHIDDLKEKHEVELAEKVDQNLANEKSKEEEILKVGQLGKKLVERENEVEKLKSAVHKSELELKAATDANLTSLTSLNELQSELDRQKVAHTDDLSTNNSDHQLQLQHLKTEHQSHLDRIAKDHSSQDETVRRLEQDLADRVDDLSLADKKHKAILRDVKRQTGVEKKRADKLATTLAHLTSRGCGSGSPASFEDVPHLEIVDSRAHTKEGSVCSNGWGVVMESQVQHQLPQHQQQQLHISPKSSSMHQSNKSDEGSVCSSTQIDSDTMELVNKVTVLQKDKYELIEQVRRLEDNSKTLNDNILAKTAIIEHYVMDKKPVDDLPQHRSGNKLNEKLRHMLDVVRHDSASDDIKLTNKRLQVMLEETLVKNISLQESLDVLSEKVQKQ